RVALGADVRPRHAKISANTPKCPHFDFVHRSNDDGFTLESTARQSVAHAKDFVRSTVLPILTIDINDVNDHASHTSVTLEDVARMHEQVVKPASPRVHDRSDLRPRSPERAEDLGQNRSNHILVVEWV